MGLRHRLGRLLSDRLDKLRRSGIGGIGRSEIRRSGQRPDRRYRPIFESLEQRVVMRASGRHSTRRIQRRDRQPGAKH